MRLTTIALALIALFLPGHPADAQNPFATRVIVNDSAITAFEVEQRARLLEVLNATGDLEQQAIDALIDDRLRMRAAREFGITLPEEAILEGMEEFAGRADMNAEEFIQALGQAGVAAETFRDFVQAGVIWREVVRARFARRMDVTEAEVNRAMALESRPRELQVLLSEIFLPTAEQFAEQARQLAPQIAELRSIDEFADAARRFSAAPTSEDGGRLDWMPLSELPERIVTKIRALSTGEVTPPIEVQNALALFQLRGLRTADAVPQSDIIVEYMQFRLPGGRSESTLAEAQAIRTRVDVCNDLYAEAQGLPQERLTVHEQALSAVPEHVAAQLRGLDTNEISTAQTEGGALVMLMLCTRQLREMREVSQDRVAERVIDQRLNALAEGYLEQLRADAYIRRP